MKEILRKLHAQRLFWKPHSIDVLCWAFYCLNDNKKVNLIIVFFVIIVQFFYLNPKIKHEED
jgi:hypothetical protein